MRGRSWLAGCGTLAVTACAQGVPSSLIAPNDDRQSVARFSAVADSLKTALRIPGLAIVILRDTSVIFSRGYGLADVARKIPATVETPFNIASVTKPISAVVALKLVEQGKLDLDRPMILYAGFPEFCTEATSAGGIFFGDYQCGKITMRNVLSMEANGTPGTSFSYNPPSYSWASRPMAEVAGVPFSELTKIMVLDPAGMSRSARINRRLPLRPDLAAELAIPYHIDSAGMAVVSEPPPPQGDGAAGGVISTAMDLARFDIALGMGRLISPASVDAMWTAGRSASGAVLPYGIGWFVNNYRGEKIIWHTGLWEGAYSALYMKVPDRHLTLILLANSDGLRWQSRLDEAAIERSPFALALLDLFK